MRIGTEHELSINDAEFRPRPVSDDILEALCGEPASEVAVGNAFVSYELQKHALEIKPGTPSDSLRALEIMGHSCLKSLLSGPGNGYRFLGLGMHPTLTLDGTAVWDHEYAEIYREYDRLFGIRQHGWLNIQALQVNFPFEMPSKMVRRFNRLRSIIPYAVAVSASSPFVEGRATRYMDNRLVYYRENQARIPVVCNGIIPEKLDSARDYQTVQARVYKELRREGAYGLCHDWVNSRGVIVRYGRKCLELKALDQQECFHSDMAVAGFVLALLENTDIRLETDGDALLDILETAMRYGTAGLDLELDRLHKAVSKNATKELHFYLPLIRRRIDEGSVAEILVRERANDGDMVRLMGMASRSLEENIPLTAESLEEGPGEAGPGEIHGAAPPQCH